MVKETDMKNKKDSRFDRELENTVSKKINKRLWVQKQKPIVLKAFSLFGLIGWSVAVPVAAMAYLGLWVDKKYPSENISYTLYFVLFGLVAGCYNAYRWLKKESNQLEKENNYNG